MTHVLKKLGHASNRGWRGRVANLVAPRVAARTPAHRDQVRAAVGLAFLAVSVYYVAGTLDAFFRRI